MTDSSALSVSEPTRTPLKEMLSKVPKVTVYFWVIKVLSAVKPLRRCLDHSG